MSLATVYQCFSHPDRVRIIALLRERPLCVQELQAVLRLSQVEVSKQLAYLRQDGFVVSVTSGTWRFYQLRDELPFEVIRHLRCLRECIDHGKLFQQEFERLRALSTKPKTKQTTKQARTQPGPRRLKRPADELGRDGRAVEGVPGERAAEAGADLTALEDHLL